MKIAVAAAALAVAMAGFAAAPANADINNHCHAPFRWVVGSGCVRWGVSTAALAGPHKTANLQRRNRIPAVHRKASIYDRWGNLTPK